MPKVTASLDVLVAKIFTAHDKRDAVEHLSLPGLLARLLAGPEVAGFPRLAAEQRGHWWRFLVRCGGKALHSRGWSVEQACATPVVELEAVLRAELRAAAGDPDGSHEVWALYQADPARPGFLQPPTPGDAAVEQAGYARNTPSILTSAIGSKSHERKVDAARSLDAEEAVYALVEFQLGAIFGGRGNYGSQIMGSAAGAGSGSPFMGARLGTGENETFRHDVSVLLSRWDVIRQKHGLRGDIWALWTEGWDGESSLPSQRLDPAFIPLARLIRLGPPTGAGELEDVWFRAGNKARVNDLTGGGNLGDPFTPLVPDLKNPELYKVRGTLEGGYGYAEVANLLFGTDAKRPGVPSPSVKAAGAALHNGRADVRVVFEGTAFEQGKTVGFYRRELLMPTFTDPWLSEDARPVREAHGEMIRQVKEVKSSLNGAARILLSGEPKPRDGDKGKITLPANHFDSTVDRDYLDRLLLAAGRHARGDDDWRGEWARRLAALALESFEETRDAVPTATARRYERIVRAQNWLERRLRRLRADAGDPEAAFDAPLPQETPA